MEQIGFAGLGLLALNLLPAAYPLTVFSRRRSPAKNVEANGAICATSPQELAERSGTTITIVRDTPDVQEVLFGKEAAVEAPRDGGVVIHMSTISPPLHET